MQFTDAINNKSLIDILLFNVIPISLLLFLDMKHSGNYTCTARNTEGEDHLTHVIHVTSQPQPPRVSLTHATHSSLNLSVHSLNDGGAPILGKT